LDALHVASAIAVSADRVVAYDTRLIAAAHELGFETVAPA
jgi:predicted nucleic acid-binding protein